MTRDEILTMKAGREMDALVAEQVMGLQPWEGVPGAFHALIVPNGMEPKPCLPPSYSTDIAAVWEVVEKSSIFEVNKVARYDPALERGMKWEACWPDKEPGSPVYNSAYGETAPIAICKATLLAILEDE